jgi:hypothetical protein
MFLYASVREAIAYLKISLTLVFPIATLDFFMDVFLHISFENSGSSWFVESSRLEDVCRIDPIV